jgi:hypothetical protein
MLVANSESFISTDYADYTDQDKRLSHKKAQEAQKEISLICPCAFCASLWLVSVLCNLRNLWMFTWSLPPHNWGQACDLRFECSVSRALAETLIFQVEAYGSRNVENSE